MLVTEKSSSNSPPRPTAVIDGRGPSWPKEKFPLHRPEILLIKTNALT